MGEEAKRARELSDSLDNESVEAVVQDQSWEHVVIFENINSGYVTIDDWADIEPKALLNAIQENTEKENIEKREKGLEELHVIGWMQEPTLDQHTNTVYWAIEVVGEKEGNFVNSIALRLGRYGFERINWVTQKEFYVPGGHLDVMLQAHTFDIGHRYQDFVKGDATAGYGIAALVATAIGGNIFKVTGFLVLLKKFWGLLIAGLAGILYKIKKRFKKDE